MFDRCPGINQVVFRPSLVLRMEGDEQQISDSSSYLPLSGPRRRDSPAGSLSGTFGTSQTGISMTTGSSVPPLLFDIRPRDYHLYYVTVPTAGDILKWSFWTRKKTVAFGVYYLHNALATAGMEEGPRQPAVCPTESFRSQTVGSSRLAIWPPPKGNSGPAYPPPAQGSGLSRSSSMLMARPNGSEASVQGLSSSTTALFLDGGVEQPTSSLSVADATPDQSDFLSASVAFERARRTAKDSDSESDGGSEGSPIEFIEILPVERYESFENTVNGSYRVPLGGVYVFCFDNTFSIQTSKQVSLLHKVVHLGGTPRLRVSRTASVKAEEAVDGATSAMMEEAQYGLIVEDESVLIAGWMLKKKRKKIQGWARRWIQINRSGLLSYSEYRGSGCRGSVDIRRCAVSRVPHRRLITLDSEEVTFHLRALSSEDFETWSAALGTFHPHLGGMGGSSGASSQPSQSSDPSAGDRVLRQGKIYSTFTPDEVAQLTRLESDLDMRMENLGNDLTRLKGLCAQEDGLPIKYLAPLEASFGALECLYGGVREYSACLRNLHLSHATCPEELAAAGQHDRNDDEVYYDLVLSDVSESEYTDADQLERYDDLSRVPPPTTPSPEPFSKPASTAYRTKLPAVAPPCNISLASILRKSIGKDSSNMVMPIGLNEPLNGLQRLCEELEYSELLDRAAAETDSLERLVLVSAFAVSAYAGSGVRAERKPFNPMLGETFEWVEEPRGLRFVSEKVSHRPLVLACHAESQQSGWSWWQEQKVKTKFWGKSVEYIPAGHVHVRIGEDHFRWSKVVSCLRNVLGSKKWIEHYGEMIVVNLRTGDEARLTFKSNGSFFGGSSTASSEVIGQARSADGRRSVRLEGRWDDLIMRASEQTGGWEVVWKAKALPPNHGDYYGFGSMSMALNDLLPGQAQVLPPSDTRLRPDQRLVEAARIDEAETEMMRLVERQRQTRAALEAEGREWMPRWFQPASSAESDDEWIFKGDYWEAREHKDWSKAPTLW